MEEEEEGRFRSFIKYAVTSHHSTFIQCSMKAT
jgi:hypothetical protein